jgi:alcohol dehydrogenase class IV
MTDQQAAAVVVLDRIPRITQGAGALAGIGGMAARLGGGAPVLLVADPGLEASGMIGRAASALAASGLEVIRFTGLKSDPSCAQIDAAAMAGRDGGAGVVVALGGGSALDVGKAAAALAPASEPAMHYALCAHPLPARPLPKICVPTTSGTGSETTRTVVAGAPDGAKVWLWGEEMKADEVVLDPVLTTGLPAALTAATGIDALVHALEAGTNVNANPANDVYCHTAIRLVATHLVRAVEHPGDLAARAGLQLAAALAGVAIDNTGTAIAHNIGHALASLRPVHHGRAVGLAILATLAWTAADDPDGRFAAVAEAMGGPRDATRLPGLFEDLLRRSGIKVSLRGEGHDDITPDRLAAQMAAPENLPMLRSTRRGANPADLLGFATTVLTQS